MDLPGGWRADKAQTGAVCRAPFIPDDDGDKGDEDYNSKDDDDNEGIRMRMSADETQTGAASRQVAIHCR